MSSRIKYLLLIGNTLMSIAMSATVPIVQLYFMQHISTQVFAFANLCDVALAATMQSFMSNTKYRVMMQKIFVLILLSDVIGFTIISFTGLQNANIRFIGMSILTSITMTVWSTLMMESINSVLAGIKLTDFQSLSKACNMWGAVLGGLLAIIIPSYVSVEWAIGIQCVANAVNAVCDYTCYKDIREV